MTLKIGFDAKRAFLNYRGLGNYSRTLLWGLSHFYHQELELFLYTPKIKENEFRHWRKSLQNTKIRTPQNAISQKLPFLWRSFGIESLVNHDGLQIYHGLSHELPFGIEKTNAKSIVTIHDLIFLRSPEFFPWLDRQVYFKKINYALEVADVVIAICEQTKSDIIERFPEVKEKVRVLYQSCYPFYFEPEMVPMKVNLSKEYHVDFPYILFVGALEARKNPLTLLKAYIAIQEKIDHRLIFIGNGKEMRKKMESLISKHHLETKVFIFEDVPSSAVLEFYKHSSVFALPSLFEGFGIPLIEAMFCKVPILTSNKSCFPEVAGPGAYYIDDPLNEEEMANGLLKVIEDSELRRNLVANGFEFVQRYHWSNTSKELFELYKKLSLSY